MNDKINDKQADLLSVLQNGVIALNQLAATIGTSLNGVLTPGGAVSIVAPSAGTITFTSSQARGFLPVTTSSGAAYFLALY